jgi:DNA-binding CsgD family transcriptional regulator
LRAGKTEAEAADLVGRSSRLLRLLSSQDGELRSALAGESVYAQSLARMADYLAALVRQEGYETLAAREIDATPEEVGGWMGIPGFAPLQELLDAVLTANRRQWEEHGRQIWHQATDEQDTAFARMWNDGKTVKEIARVLGWETAKIYSRARTLDLPRRHGQFKPVDEATLTRLWPDKTVPVREIAERFGVSVPTVTKRAMACGLPPRGSAHKGGGQLIVVDEEALGSLWADDRLTLVQIAEQLGVSTKTAATRAGALGLPARKTGRKPSSPRS